MQVASGLGVLLVAASAWLAYLWIGTERWILGYEYLAWILGFGVAGVVLIWVTREVWRDRPVRASLFQIIVILVSFLALLYGIFVWPMLPLLRGWP